MKTLSAVLSALALASIASGSPVDTKQSIRPFAGTQVVRVDMTSHKDVQTVKNLIKGLKLDVWETKLQPGGRADIVVPAGALNTFNQQVGSMHTKVMHQDLALSIQKESAMGIMGGNGTYFDSYHSYEEHLKFIDDLVAANPNNAEKVSSGTSLEKREIAGIHIFGEGGKGSKPAAVFHGQVHAREWIAGMVVENIAEMLLSDEGKEFRDSLDFYIFPIVNPDGFVFTQEGDNKENRMWRKNRQKGDGSCMGTDINRNWNYKWDLDEGASTDPCAEDYKGTGATSEPETKGLQAFVDKVSKEGPGGKLYIDFHSYSQLLMSPYGWSCEETAPNNDKVQKVLGEWSKAIEGVHGTKFEYGPTCTTIYQTSGDSADYAYGTAKMEYALAVELRDKGDNGFVLPPDQIKPSCEEMWAGMKVLLKAVAADTGNSTSVHSPAAPAFF